MAKVERSRAVRWIVATLAAATVGSALQAKSISVCARPLNGFLANTAEGPVGLETDLLGHFADAEDHTIEIRWKQSFPDVLAAVEKGECDVGAAAITITEKRREVMDFSLPYFPGRSVVVEATSTNRAANGIAGLAGVRVAVIRGTIHEDLLSQQEGVEKVYVKDDDALWQSVATGKAQALICDGWQTLQYFERFPGLHISGALSGRTNLGFAFPKGSELGPAYDRHFEKLRANGTYEKLLVRHFGEDLAESLLEEP